MQTLGTPRVDTPRLARVPATLALLIALAAGAFCYAPALRAFFAQDDFAFLALVRLLHQPWLLFVHDHFPASLYFRPLGVFVWWCVCAVADATAWPQYAVNMVLHLGCVAALYALLQRLRRDAWLNALWAALFAVHPLAVGTTLWLSDRFDLLTTLFSLLAVEAALAYAARPRASRLVLVLAALLCALLSKELGVVGSAAAFAAVAFAPRVSLSLAQRASALAAISLLTLGWLAYRHAMLTPIPGLDSMVVSPATFAEGAWRWLRTGGEFLAHDPRMTLLVFVLLAIAAMLWLGAVIASRLGRRSEDRRWGEAAAVAALCLMPGFVQAPVAVHHLGDLDAQTFWFALIVASRFYHLALAGLICALMLAASPLIARNSRGGRPRLIVAGALVLALVALAPATQGIAHAYASETRKQVAPLQAFDDALARSTLPAHGCQVYVLGADAIWGLAGYADAIAKGLAVDPARVAHCLIATERLPYTYFVRTGSVQPEDYRPLQPLALAGKAVPWLTLGDVQAIYFTMGEDLSVATLPASTSFLEYRDGAFVDVSEAVRSGQRKIDFAIPKPH